MKPLEHIEKLTPQELEQISLDTSVKVPEGLAKELSSLVAAAELSEAQDSKRQAWPTPLRYGIAAVAVALLALSISLSVPKTPKDTFSDPYLAYAQVQEVFDKISKTSNKAAQIAGKAVPVIEKTDEIIATITK